MDSKIKKSEIFKLILTWMDKCRNDLDDEDIDLQELANLLQSFGFYIRYIDQCHPDETTPLSDSKKGIRVLLTCNHSGLRFYMEKPLDEITCSCNQVLAGSPKKYDTQLKQKSKQGAIPKAAINAKPAVSIIKKGAIQKLVDYLIQTMGLAKKLPIESKKLKSLSVRPDFKRLGSQKSSAGNFNDISSLRRKERCKTLDNAIMLPSPARIGKNDYHFVVDAIQSLSQIPSIESKKKTKMEVPNPRWK